MSVGPIRESRGASRVQRLRRLPWDSFEAYRRDPAAGHWRDALRYLTALGVDCGATRPPGTPLELHQDADGVWR